ncbi:ribonucleoside-diphosphate reductase, adenosylcobalamin-dependent, partial [Candidatus Woesearchaeota archaeon]|nr:ribonucleoside-diphosphate reductase, adenosylcobalamin-dependent [Candidatus Woesearchaeota archaeon]
MKKDEFSDNVIEVLKQRYLLKDIKGKVIETPEQLFKRVAKAVSKANKKLEKEFFNLMLSREFLPNSPTLMNAGTDLGQLSACFVLPVEDSIESIFDAVKEMALIHQSGGG